MRDPSPRLVGLLAALTLVAGGVSAAVVDDGAAAPASASRRDGDGDAEARAEAALRQEAAALAAYRGRVRPVATAVVGAVQPLSTAFETFGSGGSDTDTGVSVRDDVLSRSGASASLRAVRTVLVAARAPAAAASQQAAAVSALNRLGGAVLQVEGVAAQRSGSAHAARTASARAALRTALSRWGTALSAVLGAPAAVPAEGAAALSPARSRGAYLQAVGQGCGRGLDRVAAEFGDDYAGGALSEASFEADPDGAVRVLRRFSALYRDAAGGVAAVAGPGSGPATVRTRATALRAAYADLAVTTLAIEKVGAASATGAQADRLISGFSRVEKADTALSRALRAVGSTTCVDLLSLE